MTGLTQGEYPMSTTSSMHLMLHDDHGNLPSYQHYNRPPADDMPGIVFVEVALIDDARLCISGTPAMLREFAAGLVDGVALAIADAEGDWREAHRSATTDVYRPETADADTAQEVAS